MMDNFPDSDTRLLWKWKTASSAQLARCVWNRTEMYESKPLKFQHQNLPITKFKLQAASSDLMHDEFLKPEAQLGKKSHIGHRHQFEHPVCTYSSIWPSPITHSHISISHPAGQSFYIQSITMMLPYPSTPKHQSRSKMQTRNASTSSFRFAVYTRGRPLSP